jgi:signal transduction histidine kinase
MRLRTRYALVLLVIMAVLGGVVLGSTELFKQRTIDQEQSELNGTTAITADQIASRIDGQQRDLRNLAARPQISTRSTVRETLQTFVNNSNFFATQIISTNGTIQYFEGELTPDQRQAAIGRNVSNRTYVEASLDGRVYVRAPEQLDDNIHVLLISVPITPTEDGGGAVEPNGVLVGALRIGPAGQSPSGAASADLLAPLQSLQRPTQSLLVTAPGLDGGTAIIQPTERVFDNPLEATATIDIAGFGPDWTLTVSRDRGALTGRLQTLQFIQGGSLLVVLLSMVGLGVWQYRTNLQQTERLLDGFDALTDGQFDYELSLSSAEEWQQISDGFNELGTGLRDREQTIQERQKQLSVINRVLRHNVQNDLTVVQTYGEMLPELGDDRLEDASETITEKVTGLVAHAQKARRIEDAMANAQDGPQDIDVVRTVERLVDEYGGEYPDVTVATDVPDEQYVSAISSLHYAVENIVENAFEHNTSENPRVDVAVRRDGDAVDVVVTDNGPGIPDHEYEVLEQDEETDLEHGSGIGLWLAYWVVVKSDGDLAFETPDDGGTVATIRLPAGTEPDDDTATEDSTAA